jgi:hypothetical protein
MDGIILKFLDLESNEKGGVGKQTRYKLRTLSNHTVPLSC